MDKPKSQSLEHKEQISEAPKLKLLTSKEAALKLRISLPTLRKIREKGNYHGLTPPPYVLIGDSEREGIRYIEHELDAWVLALPRYHSTSHIE